MDSADPQSVQLQGAQAPDWLCEFKCAQRDRWALCGSPEGSGAELPAPKRTLDRKT